MRSVANRNRGNDVMAMLREMCENMNHRRSDAPVGHCPQCGQVVNASMRAPRCEETKHAVARRRQNTFCVDCGLQLVRPA